MRPSRPARAARWLAAAVLGAGLVAGCDDYPRDPDDTLEEVRGGVMRVGLLSNPPWVRLTPSGPDGVEVALVRELADRLGARIDWMSHDSADVMDALKRRELDLVVGGLTAANPWQAHVAFTRPYYRENTVVAAPVPAPLGTIDGLQVAVDPGTTEPALVRGRGGIPVAAPAAGVPLGLAAMAEWQVGPGLWPVFHLHADRHVFALPKGENAWLIAVDRFLADRSLTVEARLRAAEP